MLVNVKQLKVQYGKQTALDIKTPITIRKGERLGVIGSNGAGKSTFVKSILGLTDYTGSIQTMLTPEQMAVHMQFNEYASTMAVRHILEAILDTKIRQNETLQELISFFDFEPCLSKKYQALSGGQKQRLTLIMVLLQNAPLTFYDEVTSGLDFESRQKLMEKLTQWYQGKDSTFVIVSHYYEELEHLVNRLLILDHGNVVAYGDRKELFERFCGKSVFIMENNKQNDVLSKGFSRLASPEHLICLSCREKGEEQTLISLLTEHDISFKRSNSDIEILSVNAKAQFYQNTPDHAQTAI